MKMFFVITLALLLEGCAGLQGPNHAFWSADGPADPVRQSSLPTDTVRRVESSVDFGGYHRQHSQGTDTSVSQSVDCCGQVRTHVSRTTHNYTSESYETPVYRGYTETTEGLKLKR
jgi:hypothetical protein